MISTASTIQPPQSYSIHLITFDLDDTLWHTSSSIKAANVACQSYVNATLPNTIDLTVYKVMKRLYSENPSAYYDSDIRVDEGFKREPVLLTKLRKDALLALHSSSNAKGDAGAFADEAFNVWRDARHFAISDSLAFGSLPALQTLRSKGYMLGGVTNGNSEPDSVKGLEGAFDFCVQAEGVGIGKPHPLIYEVSLAKARELRSGLPTTNEGGWWVHVGDDLIKDCVASNIMGARTILTTEYRGRGWDAEGTHVVSGKGGGGGVSGQALAGGGGGGEKTGGDAEGEAEHSRAAWEVALVGYLNALLVGCRRPGLFGGKDD